MTGFSVKSILVKRHFSDSRFIHRELENELYCEEWEYERKDGRILRGRPKAED
jgi:hypothetical protein